MLSVVQPSKIHLLPLANGSNSKYFFIYKEKDREGEEERGRAMVNNTSQATSCFRVSFPSTLSKTYCLMIKSATLQMVSLGRGVLIVLVSFIPWLKTDTQRPFVVLEHVLTGHLQGVCFHKNIFPHLHLSLWLHRHLCGHHDEALPENMAVETHRKNIFGLPIRESL